MDLAEVRFDHQVRGNYRRLLSRFCNNQITEQEYDRQNGRIYKNEISLYMYIKGYESDQAYRAAQVAVNQELFGSSSQLGAVAHVAGRPRHRSRRTPAAAPARNAPDSLRPPRPPPHVRTARDRQPKRTNRPVRFGLAAIVARLPHRLWRTTSRAQAWKKLTRAGGSRRMDIWRTGRVGGRRGQRKRTPRSGVRSGRTGSAASRRSWGSRATATATGWFAPHGWRTWRGPSAARWTRCGSGRSASGRTPPSTTRENGHEGGRRTVAARLVIPAIHLNISD